jgi:hypothetical protein
MGDNLNMRTVSNAVCLSQEIISLVGSTENSEDEARVCACVPRSQLTKQTIPK